MKHLHKIKLQSTKVAKRNLKEISVVQVAFLYSTPKMIQEAKIHLKVQQKKNNNLAIENVPEASELRPEMKSKKAKIVDENGLEVRMLTG